MTITYTIPGVPLLDQLKEASNPTYDCVFESNAAMATTYLGKPFTGTQIKAMDSDYGPGYTGGASEANLVDTMARLGIKVARVAHDTQQQLIDELHWQIEHYHHACIITMPSQWNSAVAAPGYSPRTYRGPSHVGLACGTGPGAIRVMNPWGGFWHDGSDAYWAARLLEGEIWVGEPATTTSATPAETPEQQVLRFWKELQADRAQIARQNQQIATLQQQLAASQAQSEKQYGEILANRAQIGRQNTTIASLKQQLEDLAKVADPKATALLEALRAALAA